MQVLLTTTKKILSSSSAPRAARTGGEAAIVVQPGRSTFAVRGEAGRLANGAQNGGCDGVELVWERF